MSLYCGAYQEVVPTRKWRKMLITFCDLNYSNIKVSTHSWNQMKIILSVNEIHGALIIMRSCKISWPRIITILKCVFGICLQTILNLAIKRSHKK